MTKLCKLSKKLHAKTAPHFEPTQLVNAPRLAFLKQPILVKQSGFKVGFSVENEPGRIPAINQSKRHVLQLEICMYRIADASHNAMSVDLFGMLLYTNMVGRQKDKPSGSLGLFGYEKRHWVRGGVPG